MRFKTWALLFVENNEKCSQACFQDFCDVQLLRDMQRKCNVFFFVAFTLLFISCIWGMLIRRDFFNWSWWNKYIHYQSSNYFKVLIVDDWNILLVNAEGQMKCIDLLNRLFGFFCVSTLLHSCYEKDKVQSLQLFLEPSRKRHRGGCWFSENHYFNKKTSNIGQWWAKSRNHRLIQLPCANQYYRE